MVYGDVRGAARIPGPLKRDIWQSRGPGQQKGYKFGMTQQRVVGMPRYGPRNPARFIFSSGPQGIVLGFARINSHRNLNFGG